jgi:hypothetical protein
MTATTFQTARLSRGRHDSPEGGTCAMELVSMLAGTSFGDRSPSVYPAVEAVQAVA